MEQVRLNKWLSQLGVCSRREADRWIAEGRVLVDGEKAVLGQLAEAHQQILCDGVVVWAGQAQPKANALPPPVWLVVNKPRGIVCTTSSKDRARTIVELISYPERVYPVGRLDKDSQGLILMTNQGSLVNQIMRGSNYHEKEYLVRVDRPITSKFLHQMASGVELIELNRTTRPCQIQATGRDTFRIILTQGLNRQIRRMCQAFHYQVLELKRIRIMNIHLGDLAEGSYRHMTSQEYQELVHSLSLPPLTLKKAGPNLPKNLKERNF